MTGSTFLTPEEVCELTGVRVGRAGKSRTQIDNEKELAFLRKIFVDSSTLEEPQRGAISAPPNAGQVRANREIALKVVSTALVINEKSERMTLGALQKRFSVARARAGVPVGDFQFRDLRAKAGTDNTDSSGDIRQAQRQLGHKSLTMTEHYVRKRRGEKIGPTR